MKNCGRWKSIREICQGISDGQNHMTAAIRRWRGNQRYRQKEARAMKIYAVKNDKDSYPNIGNGLLEVSESRPTFFRLVGNNRNYPYRDFTFYDRNGVQIPKQFLRA
nr:MAG TPA: hypothetical protein [Caudoviricetes sp.]